MADGDAATVELEEIRCGNRIYSGRAATALHEHPVNKDLIAHFKSKGGDSVSWGIAESIEKYEEDTKKKVLWGADIAALYDQETERELTKEVENRIEEVLSDDAAVLEIRQFLKNFHENERAWDASTCEAAARGGHLECLKYLHEHGCPWDESACLAGTEGGHLECLKYLHENECPWSESACLAAAKGGQLECLKYAHEHGCPWSEWACLAAAEGGHLECLKYLHENGCPWDESACDLAAKVGLQILYFEYLHENRCPRDESACAAADEDEDGEVAFLKYLHEKGCPWDEGTCQAVAWNGHLECIKYLREHNSRKRKTSS